MEINYILISDYFCLILNFLIDDESKLLYLTAVNLIKDYL